MYNDDFLPPLYALGYSREKAATPLELQVHYKSSMNSSESWNSTLPQVMEAISCLEIPQHGQVTHLSLRTTEWNNFVYENALFVPFLYHLRILEIAPSCNDRKVLNVLPFCHQLREFKLSLVDIPPFAHDVDFPFIHILQKLSLRRSTLAWMDGLVFTQLKVFVVDEPSSLRTFKQKVGMPACTHIVFRQEELQSLPVFQSNFHLPLLDQCLLLSRRGHDDKRVTSALQWIHAKRFKLCIDSSSPRLMELLESKDEVEQLGLTITDGSRTDLAQVILTRMSAPNHITRKVPCPNMKVLRLQFDDVREANREQVSQSCRQMMDNRRFVGYFLRKCYIWWSYQDWEEAAPLVLVMDNEVIRTEE